MAKDLIKYISDGVLTNAWANGRAGEFDDIDNNCLYRFCETDKDCKRYLLTEQERAGQPVLACGFVGWLIKKWGQETTVIFDGYLSMRLRMYKEVHKKDVDLWKRNLETEFYSRHKEREIQWIKQSEALYEFLTGQEIDLIQSYIDSYFSYVDSKAPADVKMEIPKELSGDKAKALFRKAQRLGLLTDSYQWNKSKELLAYFVEQASTYLNLGKGEYQRAIHSNKSVSKTKIAWKPFEILFSIRGLAIARQSYDREDRLPSGYEAVDKLFSD